MVLGVLLAILLSSGCSTRHRTLLSESDLTAAAAQSLPLDDYLALPSDVQRERTARAEKALRPLVAAEAVHDADNRRLSAPLTFRPSSAYKSSPTLGDVIEHLDAALGLDPTRADLWLKRGQLLDLAGDPHRARGSLAMAWQVTGRVPDQTVDSSPLRRDIAVTSAWIERDDGRWETGLAWLDRARHDLASDDSEAVLLRGLLLAGAGDLVDAMRLSYGIPPVELPVVYQLGLSGFLGLKRQKSDILKRWLQAEVCMRRGDLGHVWHVLGEIPYWRRITAIPHRLYQDIGLYAEMSGAIHKANMYYALAYVRREYRQSSTPVPFTCDPVIRGLPDRDLNFYRLESGVFHGGSLAAYAFSSSMLALVRIDTPGSDVDYLRAVDAIETCLRRGILPDEVLALRGRLRFSRGYYVLAEMDLVEARSRFATDNEVEPWTSYLLGLIAMGRDRPEEAVPLLAESLEADPNRSDAWDALGVARLQLGDRSQARLAFDRAVAVDPIRHTAWFNRGLLRCQEGNLTGGLEDLKQAANLAPESDQLARVIQLAQIAQREGRQFLSGLDDVGRWEPAAVEVLAHEGSAFAPTAATSGQVGQHRLGELLDNVLAEVGAQARADGLDAAALTEIEAVYHRNPTPAGRKLLAHVFVWLDLFDEARAVLAPHWGQDLDGDEVLLLLWLEQRAGEDARLHDLSRQMARELSLEVDQFDWNGLLSMLNERADPVFTGQTTFARFDIERRSISLGGQWSRWLQRQMDHVADGTGGEDGGMLVDPRGRTYHFPRGGGSGETSVSTTPVKR